MFLKFCDKYNGKNILINVDDISHITEEDDGACFVMKTVADDFDKTKHPVKIAVKEDFDTVFQKIAFYEGAK